jgi:lysozyme
MMDVGGGDVQPQMITGADGLSGPTLDRFNAILERFDAAISSLSKRSAEPSTPSFKSGGGGAAQAQPQEGMMGTSGGAGMTSAGAGTPEQKALLDAVSFAEGTSKSYGTIFGGKVVPELEKGELTVRQVHDMMMTGKLNNKSVGYGSGSRATGRYQFMPDTLSDIVKSGAISWNDEFTNELQDKAILARISSFRGVTPELLAKEGLSAKVSNMLAPEFASLPTYAGKSFYNQPVKSLQNIQNVYNQSIKKQKTYVTETVDAKSPTVVAAPTQATTQQQVAQQVSQPPPSQQKAQVNVLPLNTGTPQPQKPRGQRAAPPSNMTSGNDVPFLPSTNHDNFLTLYSKIVYNIVDG